MTAIACGTSVEVDAADAVALIRYMVFYRGAADKITGAPLS